MALDSSKSAGGWNFYVPMTFKKSVKVVAEGVGYFHIGYQQLPANSNVKTFTGKEDYSKVKNMYQSPEALPTKASSGTKVNSSGKLTGSGDKIKLLDVNGSRSIYAIKVRIPELQTMMAKGDFRDLDPRIDRYKSLLQQIRIRAYWDGEKNPSVDAPIGSFFTTSIFAAYETKTLAMGILNDGTMYCYLPMPFKSSGKVELIAMGAVNAEDITAEVYHAPFNGPWEHTGYFKTQENIRTQSGQPVLLLKESGMGQLVGVVQNIDGPASERAEYLEGDELLYVDGKYTSTWLGTGNEDMYGAGWYFSGDASSSDPRTRRGIFNHPLYGLTERQYSNINARENWSMYRLFVNDVITFRDGISFWMEASGNPPINGTKARFNTLALYYLMPGGQKMVKTDSLDHGNAASLKAHNYKTGVTPIQKKIPAIYDMYMNTGKKATLSGVWMKSWSEFTMKIDPDNDGILLRRTMDVSMEMVAHGQSADVYVNGQKVGIWMADSPIGYDTMISAVQTDFIIPAQYTRGRQSATIKVDGSNSAVTWTEFGYTVYSINGPKVDKIIKDSTGNTTGKTSKKPTSNTDNASQSGTSQTSGSASADISGSDHTEGTTGGSEKTGSTEPNEDKTNGGIGAGTIVMIVLAVLTAGGGVTGMVVYLKKRKG
mgnify:CR=1 FL=1